MLFTENQISNEELNSINNFFDEIESELVTVSPEQAHKETSVSKYLSSLTTGIYAKSVEDIANTNVGNKIVRKRNLQQVMRESFFYGSNRFGNNFIAQREQAEGEGLFFERSFASKKKNRRPVQRERERQRILARVSDSETRPCEKA